MGELYIGIDNGIRGAVCFLPQDGGMVLAELPVESDGKKKRLDPSALAEMLEATGNVDPLVIVEKPAGSKSASAAASMADSFAVIRSVLAIGGFRRQFITAKTWQKSFWTVPKMAKGVKFDTKAAALKVARELWPAQSWLASPRCRVPHDGMIDAALMAEHARRLGL